MRERQPFEIARLRPKSGQCFICQFISGDPEYGHYEVARTHHAVAFMNKYPTLEGYVMVAPSVMRPERVYILSLGSQAANSHVHWHIAPLPPGVPLEEQQYHALMHEHGAVEISDVELEQLAKDIRKALPAD